MFVVMATLVAGYFLRRRRGQIRQQDMNQQVATAELDDKLVDREPGVAVQEGPGSAVDKKDGTGTFLR